MMLFNSKSIYLDQGLSLIRILVGALAIYHGIEIFDGEVMSGYFSWDTFNNPYGKYLVYIGKFSELISGILIMTGLFTRLGSIILIGTMLYITFFVGQGRFWYQDQHPFLFAILGLVFFFYGSGVWSLDKFRSK